MLKMSTKFEMGDVMQRLKQAKENTLDQLDAEVLLNFYAVTATFDHPVTWRIEKDEDRHAVGTDDEIFDKLNSGFTRHVRLSDDFERKTQPRELVAFPGSGGVVGFNPVGVKVPAGEWDEANAEDVQQKAGEILRQEYGKLFK